MEHFMYNVVFTHGVILTHGDMFGSCKCFSTICVGFLISIVLCKFVAHVYADYDDNFVIKSKIY